jgi:hypothetical protein
MSARVNLILSPPVKRPTASMDGPLARWTAMWMARLLGSRSGGQAIRVGSRSSGCIVSLVRELNH